MGRNQTHTVSLTREERDHLENMVSSGIEKTRKLTRARILLKADENWIDDKISKALNVGTATVGRIRKTYHEEGLERALNRQKSKRVYKLKIDGEGEAHLTALACSQPPEGRSKWTLELLADQYVQLRQVEVESVSTETVRRTLKKTNLSLGKGGSG